MIDDRSRRPWRVTLIATLLAGMAAGCTTVGPNFKPPPAPTTTQYTSPGERTAPDPDDGSAPPQSIALGQKVTGDWWTLLRSPDLDGLVKQANPAAKEILGFHSPSGMSAEDIFLADVAVEVQTVQAKPLRLRYLALGQLRRRPHPIDPPEPPGDRRINLHPLAIQPKQRILTQTLRCKVSKCKRNGTSFHQTVRRRHRNPVIIERW